MNIIWDFDGTIFDTYPRILDAFDAVLNEKYELAVPRERIEDLVYIDTKQCAKVIAAENDMDFQQLLREIRSYYDTHGDKEQMFPEVLELFRELSGVRHFLVTHRDRESLEFKLNEAGIIDHFEVIITGDDGFPEKPDPASFQHVMKKYSLALLETIAIGDRDIDAGAGKNAGIKTVLISKRENEDADLILKDHSSLIETVKQMML